jgi:hypothetical protein
MTIVRKTRKDNYMKSKTKTKKKNYFIRSQGNLDEQIERLCKAWNVDASKAIRRAVAEADAREFGNGK